MTLECSSQLKEYLEEYKIKRFDDLKFNDLSSIGSGGSAIIYYTTFQEKGYAVKSYDINLCMDDKTLKKFIKEDFPFDDPYNLIKFKYVVKGVDVEKLPKNLLIDALEKLSVAPEYKIYRRNVVAHLELRLRTLKATLEIIVYDFVSLQLEFRDKLLKNLKTYIDLHYGIVASHVHCRNYNIDFLLIHLFNTLQNIPVDEIQSGKPLKKSITPEINIHSGVPMPQDALNFLQNFNVSNFNCFTGWYKKWRDLLNVRHSLEIATKQSHDFLQYHKEIFLLEFFWRYAFDQISDQIMPVTNILKETLTSKNKFLYFFDKKDSISSLNLLWFGTLDIVQDICYTTTDPIILAVCYYLSLESLRKSQCIFIKFKSLEILLSLLFNEREQFRNMIKEEILRYCDESLFNIVHQKLQLDDELIKKSKNYDVPIFQEKYLAVNIFTLLKDIIKEKLILRKDTGDFLDLKCGHKIDCITINNQKICPFCKTNIDPKLMYDFTSSAILKNFYEKAEDLNDNIINEQQILKNIYSKSKLLKKAKDAEEQERYSDAIKYLDQVIQFYPKSYKVQCRKAYAIFERGLKENPEIAIRSHVKARDILTLAIKLKPEKSLAYICRGRIYFYHNNNIEALRDFEYALKLEPNNRDAHFYKITILNEVENLEKFNDAKNEIIKRKIFNSIPIISLLTTIKPRKMIFGLGNSLPVKLYSLDDSTISGYVYFKVFQKFKEAIKSCTQAIKFNDKNAIALGVRGISYHKNKSFSDALDDFTKILNILPNNKIALGLRGKSYLSIKEYDKSLVDLNEAIESNNEDFNN
ncbi:47_t:CDS:2, partial [Scutellospora calospora]